MAPLAGQLQPSPQYRFRKRDKVMFYGRKIMRKVTHAAGPLLPQRGRLQTVPRVEQGPGVWGRSDLERK